MKTKIFLIAVAAVMLLSFTLVSVKKTSVQNENTSEQNQKGFAIQDSNQF